MSAASEPGNRPLVAVFGASEPAPGEVAYEQARAVGDQLARLGYSVITGGYGGVMAAASQGAVEAGGAAVGVTCSVWSSKPNAFVTEVVATDSLDRRLAELTDRARGGYVCMPGATGTLLELASVWEHMAKRMMPVRPLVCVGDFWLPVIELMGRVRPKALRYIAQVADSGQLATHFPAVGG